MSKRQDQIEKVTPVGANLEVPSFMTEADLSVNETLKEYVVPNRVKIVQSTSAPELLQNFNPGDVILTPTLEMVAPIPTNDKGRWNGENGLFRIVPIFFYPEWVSWNPLETRGKEPAIRERTLDKSSPLVAKCRTLSLRTEAHPILTDKKIEHREHLNFLCMVESEVFVSSEPVVISFSKTTHAAGSKLASLVRTRRAPLYGCVFQVSVFQRQNEKGAWFTFEVGNPACLPFIQDKDQYMKYKELHEEFARLHAAARIQVSYDDTPEEEVGGPVIETEL